MNSPRGLPPKEKEMIEAVLSESGGRLYMDHWRGYQARYATIYSGIEDQVAQDGQESLQNCRSLPLRTPIPNNSRKRSEFQEAFCAEFRQLANRSPFIGPLNSISSTI
jgi:hypothetical protein